MEFLLRVRELNGYGGLYTRRYPQLKIKVVDGSSLVVAVILNSMPKETTQVLLTGNLTKVATLHNDAYLNLNNSFSDTESKVVLTNGSAQKIWLVGDGLTMNIPKSLENVYSCENWLPRRVMSAWRIAGIVHALQGWNEHECGYTVFDIDKVWDATLRHGFQPLITKNTNQNKY
ncbi:hypothetical protein M0R45_002654 [Rubus argutus]|uniref:Very-long-chain aldehyde decarbonylase CER1-like C-terminal domain-containing protein n=1 Tax=Rubus argutus TaxID=59490 RepID=A0AAW1VQ95_RUBAR